MSWKGFNLQNSTYFARFGLLAVAICLMASCDRLDFARVACRISSPGDEKVVVEKFLETLIARAAVCNRREAGVVHFDASGEEIPALYTCWNSYLEPATIHVSGEMIYADFGFIGSGFHAAPKDFDETVQAVAAVWAEIVGPDRVVVLNKQNYRQATEVGRP